MPSARRRHEVVAPIVCAHRGPCTPPPRVRRPGRAQRAAGRWCLPSQHLAERIERRPHGDGPVPTPPLWGGTPAVRGSPAARGGVLPPQVRLRLAVELAVEPPDVSVGGGCINAQCVRVQTCARTPPEPHHPPSPRAGPCRRPPGADGCGLTDRTCQALADTEALPTCVHKLRKLGLELAPRCGRSGPGPATHTRTHTHTHA